MARRPTVAINSDTGKADDRTDDREAEELAPHRNRHQLQAQCREHPDGEYDDDVIYPGKRLGEAATEAYDLC